MSDENVKMEVIAAVYPNLFEARAKLNDLVALHKSGAIELIDGAVLVRERTGSIRISEQAELTPGKGARRGALIGAVIGVVFPPSLLAGAVIGAAAGAITGKATDQGIKNDMLEELAAGLDPGKSAILAVVEPAQREEVLEAVEGYEQVFNRTISADPDGTIQL